MLITTYHRVAHLRLRERRRASTTSQSKGRHLQGTVSNEQLSTASDTYCRSPSDHRRTSPVRKHHDQYTVGKGSCRGVGPETHASAPSRHACARATRRSRAWARRGLRGGARRRGGRSGRCGRWCGRRRTGRRRRTALAHVVADVVPLTVREADVVLRMSKVSSSLTTGRRDSRTWVWSRLPYTFAVVPTSESEPVLSVES